MWQILKLIWKWLKGLMPKPPGGETMANALQVDMMASGVVDGSGVPLAGGKVYTYAAGTTTDKAVYTDAAMTTPEANPVILNAAGVKNVYAYGNYKFVIKDANDVTIRTLDNQYYMVPSTTAEVVNSIAFADSPYSASAENQLIKVNTAAGAVTIYLPTAVGNEGIEIVVVKTSSDANAVTLDSNTLFTQDINGANTAVLGTDQYSFLGVMSDNANWFVSQNVNTATVTASSTTTMTNKTLTTPVIASFYQDAGKTKLMTTPNTASDTLPFGFLFCDLIRWLFGLVVIKHRRSRSCSSSTTASTSPTTTARRLG
jgi:hypothetical protein